MPAKSPQKKEIRTEPPELETPHPQILPQATKSTESSQDAIDLEAMLEDDAEESVLEKKNIWLYRAGIAVTVGIIFVTLAVFTVYLNAPKADKQVKEAPQELAQMTPTPIAFRPGDITIEVLNASGVAGAAARAAAALEAKGYSITGTGNTKKQTATQLMISQSVQPSIQTFLKADIASLFDISSGSAALTGSTASARLIIGSQ